VPTTHRLFIDESGDHTYRHLEDLNRRYLGITGLLIRKDRYVPVPESVEALKRQFFHYDPDAPPILTRAQIMQRKSAFWVLRDPVVNARWEKELLRLYQGLPAQIFTVAIDKKTHYESFGDSSWNPYCYSLAVLLWRVRGYLNVYGGTADIMPESRGRVEDKQLLDTYQGLRKSEDIRTGRRTATRRRFRKTNSRFAARITMLRDCN